MAEFKEIIDLFNEYCKHNSVSMNTCDCCHFNYRFNTAHIGCINYIAKFPDDTEKFLTAWKQKQQSGVGLVSRFIDKIRGKTEARHKQVSQAIQQPKQGECCTLCGKVLDEWDRQEDFGFNYYIGYGSKHDCSHAKAQFCCECFDNILDALKECGASDPIVDEYG